MRRRILILPLVLAALAVLLIIAHKESIEPVAPGAADQPARLRWPAGSGSRTVQKISIVHFNDLHASYQPRDYDGRRYSPLSLIRGLYVKTRGENPYTLFVSAGDELEKGSLADLLSLGESTIEIYRQLGLHLRAIGNHDFAYSLPGVLRLATEPGDVTLCANQRYPADPDGWARPWVEFTIGAVRVGAFSLVSKPWDDANRQYDGPFYPQIEARYDFVPQAREIVAKLRPEVDLVLFVSHLGRKDDLAIANQVPGIDVIIAGHDHRLPEYYLVADSGTIIAQAHAYGKAVGRLDLEIDLSTRRIVGHERTLTEVHPDNMPADEELERHIRQTIARHAPGVDEPVATVAAALDRPAVAGLAARAAMQILGVDAAVFDVKTVRQILRRGMPSRQHLLDAIRVEYELVGTNGYNSTHVARVSGGTLAAIRAGAGGRFAYRGPSTIDPTRLYTLALQKRTARLSRKLFPGAAAIPHIRFRLETYELLARYGESRTAQGLTLDGP